MRNRFNKILAVLLIVALTGTIPELSVLAAQTVPGDSIEDIQTDEPLAEEDAQDEGQTSEKPEAEEDLPARTEEINDAGVPVEADEVLEEQLTQEEMSLLVYQDGGAEVAALGASDLSGAREALEAGLRARQTSIDIQAYAVDRSELSALYSSVLNFNPDLFYVVSACGYSRNTEGMVLQIRPIYDTNYTEEDIKIYQAAVERAYEEALPSPGGMTDIQKAMALHDYLAQHMSYDFTYSRYNSYNALVERSAVCQGYTLAYAELLKKAGIPFDFCTSTAMNHIWNYVQIGGKWYHVDVTWDDPTRDKVGYVSHAYFLNSDSKIEKGGHSNWTAAQTCQDTAYDEAYWQEAASAVFCIDGAEYYLKENNRKTELVKRQRNTEEVLQTLDAVWKVWGSNNSYWRGTFSRLSCYNGTLFFNDTTKIYQFIPGSSGLNTVYTYTGNDGYIYGALVCDGTLTLGVAENPNVEATRSTVPLPDAFMPSVLSVEISATVKSVLSGYTEAPVLTAQVTRGSASSQDPLQYQWYKVAGDGTETALSGANTDQYTVEPGLGAGIYVYRVEVSDGNHTKSAECTVKVFPSGTAFHTITFDENNGEGATSQQVFDNDQAAAPEDPVRPGYQFAGWYLGDEPYDFNLPVTRDLTLTAKWEREAGVEPAVYTVTFDCSDGGEPTTIQVTEGEKAVLPEEPTRTGYRFKGWYLEGEPYDFDLPVTKDLTLTAQWEAEAEIPGENDDPQNSIPEDDIPPGGIPDDIWIAGNQDQVYTGKAIKPEVRVYDGKQVLVQGKDYTVSYKNNTKVTDAAGIIVKGKGNYTGTYNGTFRIMRKNISDEDMICDFTDAYVYQEGKTPRIVFSLKYSSKALKKGSDYTISYEDGHGNRITQISALGEYVMKVNGTGSYEGELSLPFSVTDKTPVSALKIGKIPAATYNGEEQRPELTVKYGKDTLTEGANHDYTVEYEHNVQAGTASAILTGHGEYVGTRRIPFKITGISIKKVQVDGLRAGKYTGKAVKQPSLQLSFDDENLEENTDYTVGYANNIKAGKATVLLTGTGGYAGTVKKSFTINPRSLGDLKMAKMPEQVPYEKGGAKPKLKLYYEDTQLKEGTDYTLSYTGNQATGSQASVTIKGKGNFSGVSDPIPFTVTAQKLSNVQMTAADAAYKASPGNYKTSVVLYDLNGKKLSAGSDYEKELTYTYVSATTLGDGTARAAGDPVEKSDTVPSGTSIRAEAVGKGSYEGTASAVFRVTEQTLKGAKVTWNREFSYTGKAVLIRKEDVTVTVKGVVLAPDEYEILTDTYRNNTGTGTASVQIRGTKAYGGTLLLKYRIRSRKI